MRAPRRLRSSPARRRSARLSPSRSYNGVAGTPYSVPAGTQAGLPYTIKAVYSGTADFLSATATAVLTVGAAATITSSVDASTTYNASSQTVPLTATVTSTAGKVNEAHRDVHRPERLDADRPGHERRDHKTDPLARTYPLPAGLSGGTYTIKAVYDGGPRLRNLLRRPRTP